jgi:hypothetical protein
MAGRRIHITLVSGIVLLGAGIFGAGLTYRSMRTENLTHARTGEVTVPFADTQALASARFRPYAAGVYRLYVGPPGPGADPCPDGAIAADLARLDGIIDVSVSEPGGRVEFSGGVGPGGGEAPAPEANGWVLIDSLRIGPADDSAWSIEVSYCPGSPFIPSCAWTVFLLPPQDRDIGSFLEGGIFRMLAFFGVMILGFVLVVVGGRARG